MSIFRSKWVRADMIAGCIVLLMVSLNMCFASDGEEWIERTIGGMTLEEKVGQLVAISLDARKLGDEEYLKDKLYWIENYHIGCARIASVPGDMYVVARGIHRMQQASKIPLSVRTNSESGAGGCILQAVRFPPAMAMGATGDSALIYQAGRIHALECKAVGLDMSGAPNGSLNNNPDNPVINVRAFGDDPQFVAKMVVAYVRGQQDQGFPAMVGLFPGHGDTDVDSHQALPTMNVHSRERLFSTELVPFIAAFEAGCASLMTAHVIIPCLDPNTPATLSKAVITDLLRKELKFDGVAYTDALGMKAISGHYGAGESAIMTLEAGNDIIFLPSDYKVAIEAVVAAVRSGRLTEERIDLSVRRRLKLKVMSGIYKWTPHPIERLEDKIGLPEYKAVAQKIADKAITVAKDKSNIVPLKNMEKTAFLMFNGSDDYAGEIRDAFPNCPVMNYVGSKEGILLDMDPDPNMTSPDRKQPPITTEKARQDIIQKVQGKSTIVIASFMGRGRRDEGSGVYFQMIDNLVQSGKNVCFMSFGDPYIYRFVPQVHTYICAYGRDDYIRSAAWKVLKGTIPARGQLPVKVPGL